MSDPRVHSLMEQVNNKRETLAASRWSDYCEGLTGWDRSVLAQILENEAAHLATLDEETKTGAIGSFEKFIFPLIRTVWPALASTDLVSVQPMEGPISMLFFIDFMAGSDKGNVRKGDALITARTGMREEGYGYASEQVQFEGLSLVGGWAPGTSSFARVPVRPGSVTVSWSIAGVEYSATDNGGGALGGGVVGESSVVGTLNYDNGNVSLTFATANPDAGTLTVTYDYNSEGHEDVPQMDISLTSTPVVSRPDKLRCRWSVEVSAQLRAIHGLEAEQELTEALAQQIRFGIDNKIINDLYRIAASGRVTFDVNPPTNVPFFTHQMSLIKTLQSGSNQIFKNTRRGIANWIVCGVDAATILESHPLFETSGNLAGPGVVFSGVFANRWKVFKNPFLTTMNPAGFGPSNFLLGYKGDNFYDAGYVYAPWIPFYQTPTVVLDDMMFRKGVMTHYGRKVVNGLFYVTGTMLNA